MNKAHPGNALHYSAPNGSLWNFVTIAKWIQEGCDPTADNAIAAYELLILEEQGWLKTHPGSKHVEVRLSSIARYELARQEVVFPKMEAEQERVHEAMRLAAEAAAEAASDLEAGTEPETGNVVPILSPEAMEIPAGWTLLPDGSLEAPNGTIYGLNG